MSHYLLALLWFVKKTAEGYDLLEIQTTSKLYDFAEFRGNVGLMCDVGIALSDQLTLWSARATKPQKKEEAAPDSLESLANQLFDLMQNPLLTTRIFDALGDGIVSVDDINSPEIVLNSLKKLSEFEGFIFIDF